LNEVFQCVAVVLTGIVGTVVVLTRDPVRQVLVLGIHGMTLVIAFFALQAPTVALSAIVVSTLGLPPMVLLALRKIREFERDEE
jgi:uncharacterized MnhB-related membrane protein